MFGLSNRISGSYFYRLRARNTSWSTLSGLSADLWHVTMFPLVLNARSEGALVAGMHRYFLASLATCGKCALCCLHHSRGFVSGQASMVWRLSSSNWQRGCLALCCFFKVAAQTLLLSLSTHLWFICSSCS